MIDNKDYLDALRKTIANDDAIKDKIFLEREKEIESLKAQLAQYQSDDCVVVKKDNKTIVAIEKTVESQLQASGITQDPFRLDGEKILNAMIETAEKDNA